MQPGRAMWTANRPRFELPKVIRQFVGLLAGDTDRPVIALEPALEAAPFAVRIARTHVDTARYAPRWG